MADYVYAGIFAPGSLALADTDGNLIPAGSATATILDADSDVPTFYTDQTKGDTTSPDLTTDSAGNWGPYYLDPGNYTYTVVDSDSHSHGPFNFAVNPYADEPTVAPVDYTIHALTLTTGTPWQNTTDTEVEVKIPVTYNATSGAAATLQIAVADTSPGSAGATEESQPENSLTGWVSTKRVLVPADWWLRADVVHATIAAGSYQAVVA